IYEVLSYCPGTITPQLKAGESCVSSGECVKGLYCKKPSGCPGTCTPFAQVGESCANGVPCDPSLECGGGHGVPNQRGEVCPRPGKAGDPCHNGNCGSTINCPSDPSFCTGNVNLWCDPSSNTCKPGVGEGAACGPTMDGSVAGSVACASNLFCDQVFL